MNIHHDYFRKGGSICWKVYGSFKSAKSCVAHTLFFEKKLFQNFTLFRRQPFHGFAKRAIVTKGGRVSCRKLQLPFVTCTSIISFQCTCFNHCQKMRSPFSGPFSDSLQIQCVILIMYNIFLHDSCLSQFRLFC